MCLNDFLLKMYIKGFEQNMDDIQEYIADIYLKMAEILFINNRDMARNAVEVFIVVF